MVNPEHLRNRGFYRIILYIIYAIAFSFFYSLAYVIQYTISAKLGGYSQPIYKPSYWIREFTVAANEAIPYVICQIIAAVLTVKALSLKKLFYLSCLFIIINSLLGILLLKPETITFLGFGFLTVERVLPFVAPVLILALINRKKSVLKPASGLDIETESTCIESGEKSESKIKFLYKKYWYFFDIILIILVLLYGTLSDPFGLIFYLCGLYNKLEVSFGLAMLYVFLLVPVSLCFTVLILRMFISWPKHISKKRMLLLLRLFVIIGLGFYLILPFTPIQPAGMSMYIDGFSRYVKANADIEAIRGWLGTIGPEDYKEYSRYDNSLGSPMDIQNQKWPESIANLKPRYVKLSLDNGKQSQVRLTWGSGFLGTWGFVVGNENLPTPASDLSRYGEYRQEILKGVYVWYTIE
jgi:hypothetical protein